MTHDIAHIVTIWFVGLKKLKCIIIFMAVFSWILWSWDLWNADTLFQYYVKLCSWDLWRKKGRRCSSRGPDGGNCYCLPGTGLRWLCLPSEHPHCSQKTVFYANTNSQFCDFVGKWLYMGGSLNSSYFQQTLEEDRTPTEHSVFLDNSWRMHWNTIWKPG